MRLLIFLTAAGVALAGCTRAAATDAAPGTRTTAVATDAHANAAAPALPAATSSHEISIPAGTTLPVVLDTSVGSATSQVEQPVHAFVSRAIVIGGATVLAAGSRVNGVVTDATRSGRVKGRAHVHLPKGSPLTLRLSQPVTIALTR